MTLAHATSEVKGTKTGSNGQGEKTKPRIAASGLLEEIMGNKILASGMVHSEKYAITLKTARESVSFALGLYETIEKEGIITGRKAEGYVEQRPRLHRALDSLRDFGNAIEILVHSGEDDRKLAFRALGVLRANAKDDREELATELRLNALKVLALPFHEMEPLAEPTEPIV